MICCHSCGDMAYTIGQDSAEYPNRFLLNSTACVDNLAAADDNLGNAVSRLYVFAAGKGTLDYYVVGLGETPAIDYVLL